MEIAEVRQMELVLKTDLLVTQELTTEAPAFLWGRFHIDSNLA